MAIATDKAVSEDAEQETTSINRVSDAGRRRPSSQRESRTSSPELDPFEHHDTIPAPTWLDEADESLPKSST